MPQTARAEGRRSAAWQRRDRASCPRRGRASRVERVLAVKPDEMRSGYEAAAPEFGATSLEEDDVVHDTPADRLHEPPVVRELLRERRWHLGERRRDEDGVERRVFGQSTAAVADDDAHVVESCEACTGGGGDVLPAFDAPHTAGDAGEQRGLPAEACADLEHLV